MDNTNTFGARLTGSESAALTLAQETADANGSPVMVLSRDGWFTICEEPPEEMEPSPYASGWEDHALVEPMDDEDDATPRRKLTRQERLQGLADSGCDTWADYRGER